MGAGMNSQKTSAVYAADSLQPRDFKLAWAREFATEVTGDTGDAFGTNATPDADIIAIEPRFGALAQTTVTSDEIEEPRGTTFLIPSWDTYETAPLGQGQDIKAIAIYGKIRFYDEIFDQGFGAPVVHFVLGEQTLVGSVPAEFFYSVGIRPTPQASPAPRGEADAILYDWVNGGASPPLFQGQITGHGMTCYVRVVALAVGSAPGKGTEMTIHISRDGQTWYVLGVATLDNHLRRVGLAMQNFGTGGLEFIRIYNYPIVSVAPFATTPIPGAPVTGSRLFVA